MWRLAIVLYFVFGSLAASATVLTAIDRAAFQQAVAAGDLEAENFDSYANGFTVIDFGAFSLSQAATVIAFADTTSPPNELRLASNFVTLIFDAPITAFAVDAISTRDPVSAFVDGVAISSTTPVVGISATFIGFISDTPFTRVGLALPVFRFFVDNVVFGDASALSPREVPAPAALALMATGLLGFAARRRAKAL